MRVLIRSQVAEIPVHTVTLCPVKSEAIYLFRCYKCGTAISQVMGHIVRIEPGAPHDGGVPVVNQCYKCKEYYTFQTKQVKPQRTELYLHHNPLVTSFSTFHCFICRTQLIQYDELFTKVLPEYKRVDLPYKFNCFGHDCVQKYILKDII
jgi:hypothetical protein